MGRALKKGFDYFPFSVDFFRDKKIRRLNHAFPDDGIKVYLFILCQIYDSSKEFYAVVDDFYYDDIACDLNISADKVRLIVDFCCKWSLFDDKLLTGDKLLSSVGIQSRFQEMVKTRAKNRIVEVPEKIWLLSEKDTESYIKVTQNSDFFGNNSNKFRKNDNKFGNNHTKESKVKKSKGNKIKAEESSNAPAADKVIHKYEQMIGFVTPAVMEGIDFVIGEGLEPELVSRIIEYACEQGKRSWQYINAALLGNLKENILTLDAYNRHQAERTECKAFQQKTPEKKAKRSKFNNYNDSNKKDYSKIQEDIFKELLEE